MRSKHGASQKQHAKDSIDTARLKIRSFHRNDPNAEVTVGHKVGEKVSEIRVNKSSCRGHKVIGLKTSACVKVSKRRFKKHFLSLRKTTLIQIDNKVRTGAARENTTLVAEEDFTIGKLSHTDKPVFVYKTVTDALAVVRSSSRKVPLVCLTDFYKVKCTDILQNRMTDIQEGKKTGVQQERKTDIQIKEFLTMSDAVPGLMDTSLDSSGLNTLETSRLSKSGDMTKGTKKQASTNSDKTIQRTRKENTEIKSKDKSLAEIKSMFDTNAIKTETTRNSVEKTPKSKNRKLKDSDVQNPTGSKEKKKSPKAKQETQPPEIVVTPPKDKPQTRHRSSESPKRNSNCSPRKKKEEISPCKSDTSNKNSPKVRKRSASASPNSKKRSPPKGKLTSDSSTSSLLHVDIPDTDSGSPSKRTRSPNARFKEDMILYPWDKRSPKRSPSSKSTEKFGANNGNAAKDVNKSPIDEKSISKQSPKMAFSPKKRHSPRKEKAATEELAEKLDKEELEPSPGSSCEKSNSAARNLSFDSCVPKAEGISSLITKDFKYKYQSSKDTNLVGLSDLITKVSSSIESTDENLNALFGQAVEQDDIELQEQDSSLSIDDSTDSDKTVTEFDSNNEVEEKTKEKDSDLSMCNNSADTSKESGTSQVENDKQAEKGEEKTENNADTTCDITCDNTKTTVEKSADEKGDNDKTVSEAVEEDKVQKNDEVLEINGTEKNEPKSEDNNSKIESESNPDSEKNSDSDLKSESKTTVEIETEKETAQETTNLFDMFGLKLKRKPSLCKLQSSTDEDRKDSEMKVNLEREEKTETGPLLTGNSNNEIVDKKIGIEIDDDVMIVSEEYPNKNKEVIVLSDDEAMPSENESKKEVKKPKFVSLMKNVEPKPLEILSKVEKQTRDKKSVFMSAELDSYLAVNKENIGPDMGDMDSKVGILKSAADVEKLLENPYPDFDEVDDMVFLSFPCEEALNAHMNLEMKVDWLHDTSIRKLAHLKSMKERQQDVGSKRMTDIKYAHEQKQNFRGVPMKLMKYNKMLKQELETILTGYVEYNEMSILKTPEKTSDITKIKGWKNKFRNAEDLQEAAGRQLSESGKLHWKTEERLLKNLDPDDVKDIGLELKKKRRKLINFSKKRGTPKSDSKIFSTRNETDDEFDDYEVHEGAITEKDVYNEDDDRPEADKLLYRDKYLSQHKYGARKMFVKKMGLDARDEMILKKLGTQKIITKETEECTRETSKNRRHQCWFTVSKLTQSMAVAAVSALDKKLISEAKTLKLDDTVMDKRGRRRSDRIAKSPRKAERTGGVRAKGETDGDQEDMSQLPEQGGDTTELGACGDQEEGISQSVIEDEGSEAMEEEEEEEGDSASDSEDDVTDEYEETSPNRKHPGTLQFRPHTRKVKKKPVMEPREGKRKDDQTGLQKDHCNQPGCRYGCICHLCKLSDSGEEKEADMKPPCDKEYCKLGCICESIDSTMETASHCRKPSCMLGCKCPPKQAKPDIPKERDSRQKKKKKGKKGRKKSKTPEKKEEDTSSPKDERIVVSDDTEDWEPPSKKKRATNNSRFANLPRRESTYRLAKNLDAVSRKAMEVYATSEMYAEVKMRRRKSDPVFEFPEVDGYQYSDLPKLTQDRRKSGPDTETKSKHQPGTSCDSRVPMETNVFEISDEESDDETVQSHTESCRRTMPYEGERARRYSVSKVTQNRKSCSDVIDLVESESEDKPGKGSGKGYKSYPPSSSESCHYSSAQMTGTVSEKMGLSRKAGQDNSKWKTQMVCLKAKKKTDDKSSGPQSEIKLLEIISNCNWENDRTNMLSKISHIISKDREFPANNVLMWQNYCLHFLPQAEKPAVIPPELKSKLPNSMYSIRIRITQSISDMERAENSCKESCEERVEEEVVTQSEALKQVQDNDKKPFNVKLQKKLIDKIKFAEKLRDLIIAEEKKGSDASKFSVSRDGIEKALKKYKTQLWKAYTGSNNMTLMQLKKAVEAAKTGQGGSEKGTKGDLLGDKPQFTPAGYSQEMNATLARIHFNQGLKIVCHSSAGGFIPLTNNAKSGITCQTSTTLTPVCMQPLSQNANTAISSTNAQMVVKQRTQLSPTVIGPASNTNTTVAKKTGVVNPVTSSGPCVTPQPGLSDVLLIPVAENGARKWDPSANPVLSAKMTIMPNGNAPPVSTPSGESVVNNAQGRSLIPMVPVAASQPVRYPNQVKKQPGLNLTPSLTGQPILLQSNQPGHSPIMINSIHPVSSSSPVYSSVQVISKSVNLTASPVPNFPLQTSVPAVSTTPAQFNHAGAKQSLTRIATPGMVSIAPPGYMNNSRPFTPPITTCSVYPIKLAPASTNVTTPLPTFPFSQGTKCIGTVPIQILQTKDKGKIIQVLPMSSSGIVAVNSDKPITTVARQTGSPLSVINQQTFPNMHTKVIFNKKRLKSGNTESKDSSSADVFSVLCENSKKMGVVETQNSASNNTEVEETLPGAVSKTPDTIAVNEQKNNNKTAENMDDSADVSDIISLAKSAGIEIALALNSMGKVDEDDKETASVVNKKDLTDDDSDSCLIIDETVNTHQPVTGTVGEKDTGEEGVLVELRKRKHSPSTSESMESQAKKTCHGISSSAVFPVTRLATTEEDDEIDVMTFDMDETDVLRPAKGSRRKAQHTSLVQPEDFEIAKVKVPAPGEKTDVAPVEKGMSGKPHRERCRRQAMKRLFHNLSRVVLKYNPKLLSFTNGIPTGAILQEARNLLQALKQKNGLLQECLDDGLQYHGSLRKQLQQHKDSMVKSGVPEKVLNNFLKSVAQATASSQGSPSTRDPLAEANDADLDYTPITTDDVVISKPRPFPLPERILVIGNTDIKPTVQEFTSILNQGVISDFQNKNMAETKCQLIEASVSSDLDPESSTVVVKADRISNDSNSVAGSDSQSMLADESDDEIRSTTGYDSLFDQDLDFMESELLNDKVSEEIVQSADVCEQIKTEESMEEVKK